MEHDRDVGRRHALVVRRLPAPQQACQPVVHGRPEPLGNARSGQIIVRRDRVALGDDDAAGGCETMRLAVQPIAVAGRANVTQQIEIIREAGRSPLPATAPPLVPPSARLERGAHHVRQRRARGSAEVSVHGRQVGHEPGREGTRAGGLSRSVGAQERNDGAARHAMAVAAPVADQTVQPIDHRSQHRDRLGAASERRQTGAQRPAGQVALPGRTIGLQGAAAAVE